MKWQVILSPKVQSALKNLPPETKHYIRRALEDIALDPEVGKPLRDELTGFHSFRVKRFRIIYQIRHHTVTVIVIGVGRRETIYEDILSGDVD